ncbi:cobamide remodeling phosphodiesterase CbiR [uncultured Desulfosarcina sp.]|uniref:cobamide remodeling phosphodiesterase CbiR n=1 Tax=uncultured Desulfosarcina sp. TaxID=218289 RepID=UPI0029C8F002|nr:cobamide remodeling phosphodiesterase CbiR [uncultured Desulfosarcina sp.]
MPDRSNPKPSFPPLQTICKNRFPFAVACPSFVYPAGYVENVRRLAPFVDEIQLLFFESSPESLPSPELVKELSDLAAGQNIGYHIHLPSDIYLGHPDRDERRRAVEAIRTILERCRVLSPSTFTLHLERNPAGTENQPVERWRQYLLESLEHMLPTETPPRKISIETLDYPLEWVAPVIKAMDLSVCMDMGHLMVHGIDLQDFYENWKDRITVVHLHGVDGSEDHLPLDRLSDERMRTVLGLLQALKKMVVLENYAYSRLNASLACLAEGWSRTATKGM